MISSKLFKDNKYLIKNLFINQEIFSLKLRNNKKILSMKIIY